MAARSFFTYARKAARTSFATPVVFRRAGAFDFFVAMMASAQSNEAPSNTDRSALVRDLRLHQLLQQVQRLAPSQVARLRGNGIGHAFLDDVDLGAHHHLLD